MTYLAAQPIQKALYSLLTTAGLTVYDEVPVKPSWPYVTISDAVETPDNTLSTHGRENIVNLHIWSKYPGNKETQDKALTIIQKIDKQTLSLTGASFVMAHFLDFRILKEEDLRHGVIRFRVNTQET